MVGTTLVELRERISSLSSEDGEYFVACARTGERPIPAAGERFDTREQAREAARATEQYRAALRRYDPRVPFHDPIVRQSALSEREAAGSSADADRDWSLSAPAVGTGGPGGAADRTEFCHAVAAAVFEALSDADRDDVESAVMDDYFHLAERLADPDELCLCLLESLAATVQQRLTPAEQAALLDRAAPRLGPVGPAVTPLSATFARLRRLGLLGGYDRSGPTGDERGGTVVEVSAYSLSPRDGRLPVLPVALELFRRRRDRRPTRIRARATPDGWRLAVATDGDPGGLVSAPIERRD